MGKRTVAKRARRAARQSRQERARSTGGAAVGDVEVEVTVTRVTPANRDDIIETMTGVRPS